MLSAVTDDIRAVKLDIACMLIETIDPLALNWRRFERVKLRATIQDYLDQWPATRAVYCNEKEGRA